MTQEEIDIMWQQAMQESIKDGEMFTRYHFAKLVAEKALKEHAMQEVQRLGQEIEQEPVGMVKDLFTYTAWEKLDLRGSTKVYLDIPPQPEQEPVAWGVFDTQNLHDMFFTKEEAQDMARLKGDGSIVKPLYTHSPKENT